MDEVVTPSTETGLATKGFSALRWNAFGAGARALCQLGITAILARRLGPAPFGVVAGALVVISLVNLYADGGIGAAIVKIPVCDDFVLRSAFTFQLMIGIAGSLTIALLATSASSLLGQPMLPKVLRILSLFFVIQAFGDTSECVLRRRLEFRRLQLSYVGSYLVGYGAVGVPLAFHGAGVWSLVYAQLIQAFLYSLSTYLMVRHPIRPTMRPTMEMFRFGAAVMSVNTANWVLSNADNVCVGRSFGAIGLGLYSRAFNLVYAPIQSVVVTAQQVLFPVYARASLSGDGMRKTYLSSVNGIGLCLLPTFLATASVPRTIILGLYGPKWVGAIAILVPLALSMPFFAVMGMAGPVLWGRGEAFREFRTQAFVALVFGLALVLAARDSPVTVAWTVLGVNVIRCIFMTVVAMRTLNVRAGDIYRCLKGPVVLGLAAALAVRTVDQTIGAFEVHPVTQLVALLVVGIGCICAGLWQFPALFIIKESRPYFRRITWIAEHLDRAGVM